VSWLGWEGSGRQKDIIARNNWWIGAADTRMYRVDDASVDAWLECPPVDGYCAGTVGIETDLESNVFTLSVRTCPSDSGEPAEMPLHR